MRRRNENKNSKELDGKNNDRRNNDRRSNDRTDSVRKSSAKKNVVGQLFILLLIGSFVVSASVSASESNTFQSKGRIEYTDTGGQQVIFDAGDLEVLFRYAAEGKKRLTKALGGVGTQLVKTEAGYGYVRAQKQESLSDEEIIQVPFVMLQQALLDSQKIPEQYREECMLATSDNLTLGRAGFVDGTMALGNNHDLLEHYMRGYLEGLGITDYELLYDEEGNLIGMKKRG